VTPHRFNLLIDLRLQLEAELLHLVPAWEEENGIQFLVDDIRIVDVILLEQEVKDAEREAKKVRVLLVPLPTVLRFTPALFGHSERRLWVVALHRPGIRGQQPL
jgi:hypothetical protein